MSMSITIAGQVIPLHPAAAEYLRDLQQKADRSERDARLLAAEIRWHLDAITPTDRASGMGQRALLEVLRQTGRTSLAEPLPEVPEDAPDRSPPWPLVAALAFIAGATVASAVIAFSVLLA